MAFREKSAWAMALVMVLTGLFYAWQVAHAGAGAVLPVLVDYVIVVIVLSVAVQIVLAIGSGHEAQAPRDERERLAVAQAGYRSGLALAAMVSVSAIVFVVYGNGAMLLHLIIASLIAAQIGSYTCEAWLLRRSV